MTPEYRRRFMAALGGQVPINATRTGLEILTASGILRIKIGEGALTAVIDREQPICFAAGVPWGLVGQRVQASSSRPVYRDALGQADPTNWLSANGQFIDRLDLVDGEQLLVSLNGVAATWMPRTPDEDASRVESLIQLVDALPAAEIQSRKDPVLPDRVSGLQHLVEWGAESDDVRREARVQSAASEELAEIVSQVGAHMTELDEELDARRLDADQESVLLTLGQLWHEAKAELERRRGVI